MNTPRCGVGAAVLDGKLIAMGKCLKRLSKSKHMTNIDEWNLLTKNLARFVECHVKNGET